MPQGIMRISPNAVEGLIDLTIDPALIDLGRLKEVLLLPERYTIRQVIHGLFSMFNGYVEVIVSSPDIPEAAQGEALPSVEPYYFSENSEDHKTRIFSLTNIKVNGTSVIKEEDKQRKMTIEIKETYDLSTQDTQDLEAFIHRLIRAGVAQHEASREGLNYAVAMMPPTMNAKDSLDTASRLLEQATKNIGINVQQLDAKDDLLSTQPLA